MYEISSDSDDDCYDKFPQRLQKLKNQHALTNLINTVNDPIESNNVCPVGTQDSDVIAVLDTEIRCDKSNLIPKEVETTSVVSTRSRRGKRKTANVQLSPVSPTPKASKRGRGRGRVRGTSVPSTPRTRGSSRRGRNIQNISNCESTVTNLTPPRRGRSTRKRGIQIPRHSQSIVTYSIGNTDEYPDASDHQALFSNKETSEPNAFIDLDESLDNEELSVKVYWQHSKVFKFNIRRLQKLTQIFDFFVEKEGVSRDRLLFTYNYKKTNKILRPDDTPDTIDYNIAKFIEGGIVNKEFSINSPNTPQKTGFRLKFQCQNIKKPLEFPVDRQQKLQIALIKCAEHMEIPITQLVFEFDGEIVKGNTTPIELDMESGDCVDVKVIK